MSTRTFGEPIKRNEDRRLLTGRALFIDDVELPGMLHVAFLRSQVAHALPLRYAPELSFVPDHALDYAMKINQLMQRPEVARDLKSGD